MWPSQSALLRRRGGQRNEACIWRAAPAEGARGREHASQKMFFRNRRKTANRGKTSNRGKIAI